MTDQDSVHARESAQPWKKGDVLAVVSIVLGVTGMCTPILPPCGILMGLISILLGYLGRRSSRYGLAVSGMVLGVLILSGTGIVIAMAIGLNYEEILSAIRLMIR